MYEVWHYLTLAGKNIFAEWLNSLKDHEAEGRIAARIARLTAENFGDCRSVGDGVWELRIDHGPGYRVYYAIAGKTLVLLLCGGDKRTQTGDIERAKRYWNDYTKRTTKPKGKSRP
jgi:putative addiction module killer protein